jgi:uncharacterized protein YcbK (DUF882 family)
MMPPRRRALVLAGAALLGTGGARGAKGASAAPERFLWARNVAGEEVALAYRAGETYSPDALRRIRHLLRDTRAGAEGPLPALLVDVLSILQEQWQHTRPLVVRSGFRTPATNAGLAGAAPGSLHLVGQAVDVTVPGLAVETLAMVAWTLSRRLGFLGIGVYPGFVHLDIGPQRVWTRRAG